MLDTGYSTDEIAKSALISLYPSKEGRSLTEISASVTKRFSIKYARMVPFNRGWAGVYHSWFRRNAILAIELSVIRPFFTMNVVVWVPLFIKAVDSFPVRKFERIKNIIVFNQPQCFYCPRGVGRKLHFGNFTVIEYTALDLSWLFFWVALDSGV